MIFRKATTEDVPLIIKMIANDELGKTRENYQVPLPQEYYTAFEKIDANSDIELIVVENENKEVVGTLHLTFMQFLTYKGGLRAQIEAVRIRDDQRGIGLGKKLFEWAIERAKQKGAHLIQLTSDKQRPEAIEFYKRLGFKASHVGFKLHFNLKKV
jgi:GNAT superfamily N-acetyltransferase